MPALVHGARISSSVANVDKRVRISHLVGEHNEVADTKEVDHRLAAVLDQEAPEEIQQRSSKCW